MHRWIPGVLLCLLPVACALERDGLGKTIEPNDASMQEEDASQPGQYLDAPVLNADALTEPETGVIVRTDASADAGSKDSAADAPYVRDAGPG